MRNYSGRGWEGSNYSDRRDIKEIAKIIRTKVKQDFPKCKFSVTIQRYSGGCSMGITLMSGDFTAFKDPATKYDQLNQYYLKDSEKITDRAKDIMIMVNDLVNSFRRDDSDSMTDYFDTNFYYGLSIGKWDQPYVNTLLANLADMKVTDLQTINGQNGLVCAFCGATKKEISFVIGASSKPDWCMIYGTGKMACPDCYDKAMKEGSDAVNGAIASYNAAAAARRLA